MHNMAAISGDSKSLKSRPVIRQLFLYRVYLRSYLLRGETALIFMSFGKFGRVRISRPTVLEILGLGLVLIFAGILFAWWH